MNKVSKYAIWFLMYSKRLLHKFSFIILLCLIPVIVIAAKYTMTGESGIFKIVLCNMDTASVSTEITQSLFERDSVINFEICNDMEAATRMVATGNADAAWIFEDDFDARIENFASNTDVQPLVKIVQRNESIPLKLSREILFGAIFEKSAYATYRNYILENMMGLEEISESELSYYYNLVPRNNSIVKLQRLNSDIPIEEQNILTSPLRGLLSLLIMLCTMAAAMYFLQDQQEGKYSWLPPEKRMAPAFASCMSASLFAGTAVFVALAFSGIFTCFINELIAMLLFTLMATGFCMLFTVFFRSPGKLGATLPGLIIVMLALSPIFFDMKALKPVRLMIPTCGYLNSVYNTDYFIFNVLYCIVIYILVFGLNAILNRNPKNHSMM